MSPRELPTHPASSVVRVRAYVEAYRAERRGDPYPAVTVAVDPATGRVVPLYLADLAALVGDPEPPDPPMSRGGHAVIPGVRPPFSEPEADEFPDRDPSDVPW